MRKHLGILAVVALVFPAMVLADEKKDIVDVITGQTLATDVVGLDGKDVKTVEGSTVKIAVNDGKVTINGAKVVETDIACTDGVIHVIDTVILPPSK